MRKLLPQISVFFLLVSFSVFSAETETTIHGIRNRKCESGTEEAKLKLSEELRAKTSSCAAGLVATQVGGWSCHPGRDCPKAKVKCNTQYTCEANSVLPVVTPSALPISIPTPVISAVPTPIEVVTPTPSPPVLLEPAPLPSIAPSTP